MRATVRRVQEYGGRPHGWRESDMTSEPGCANKGKYK